MHGCQVQGCSLIIRVFCN